MLLCWWDRARSPHPTKSFASGAGQHRAVPIKPRHVWVLGSKNSNPHTNLCLMVKHHGFWGRKSDNGEGKGRVNPNFWLQTQCPTTTALAERSPARSTEGLRTWACLIALLTSSITQQPAWWEGSCSTGSGTTRLERTGYVLEVPMKETKS